MSRKSDDVISCRNCTNFTQYYDVTTTTEAGTVSSPPATGDYLFIHPHWLKYRDDIDNVPDAFMFAIGVYITIVCLTGVMGNVGVILVFIRSAA